MKTTIFALSFAAIAAMTGSTGASAFASPPVAHESAAGKLTSVTFYGDGHYYNYDKGYYRGYNDGYSDHGYRHYYRKPYYRGYKHYHWNKHRWYGYKGYCYYHPYSWRCNRDWN
jgi:hypothetical protein